MLIKCVKPLGLMSNNLVELEALIEGLKLSQDIRIKKLIIQGESQIRALGAIDDQDLEEAENDLLFSSPKMRTKELISNRRNQDQQKSAAEINSETEKNTTKAKAIRGASKFWLTPIEYLTSPFTPMEVQPESQIEKIREIILWNS